ncbi:thermonuclease family protein [Erythrobacter litoralis]|uniref:thermonuclease family protein n=1 Tax=Erythrobacter litoralis TaxID=39960 RepID=UPI002435426E|nr:thermonuclease family protein [Erythrobacter litoralis]
MTFGDQRIRLAGIDAPEKQQTCPRNGIEWACGQEATEILTGSLDGKQLRCTTGGHDRYDGALATCIVGQADIARMMLAAGFAFVSEDASEESKAAYQQAMDTKLGIWDGEVQIAAEWRSAHPQPTSPVRNIARATSMNTAARKPRSHGGSTVNG